MESIVRRPARHLPTGEHTKPPREADTITTTATDETCARVHARRRKNVLAAAGSLRTRTAYRPNTIDVESNSMWHASLRSPIELLLYLFDSNTIYFGDQYPPLTTLRRVQFSPRTCAPLDELNHHVCEVQSEVVEDPLVLPASPQEGHRLVKISARWMESIPQGLC